MKHQCIRPGCSTQYEDNDPEPYYCGPCNEARKAAAAEIDAKIALRPKERVVSDLKAFEAKSQARGSAMFIRASDL